MAVHLLQISGGVLPRELLSAARVMDHGLDILSLHE